MEKMSLLKSIVQKKNKQVTEYLVIGAHNMNQNSATFYCITLSKSENE